MPVDKTTKKQICKKIESYLKKYNKFFKLLELGKASMDTMARLNREISDSTLETFVNTNDSDIERKINKTVERGLRDEIINQINNNWYKDFWNNLDFLCNYIDFGFSVDASKTVSQVVHDAVFSEDFFKGAGKNIDEFKKYIMGVLLKDLQTHIQNKGDEKNLLKKATINIKSEIGLPEGTSDPDYNFINGLLCEEFGDSINNIKNSTGDVEKCVNACKELKELIEKQFEIFRVDVKTFYEVLGNIKETITGSLTGDDIESGFDAILNRFKNSMDFDGFVKELYDFIGQHA